MMLREHFFYSGKINHLFGGLFFAFSLLEDGINPQRGSFNNKIPSQVMFPFIQEILLPLISN